MSAKFVWTKDPIDFIGHLENVSKTKTLEVAKKIFDGIVVRTPVRTGGLRASWRASVGTPDYSVTVGGSPSTPLPPPSFGLTSMPLYGKVIISNAAKHVLPIEYGWSKRAPQGMVRVTLASFGVNLSVRR